MAEYKPEDYLIYFSILLVVLYFSYKYLFRRIPFDRRLIIVAIPSILFSIGIRLLVDIGYFEKSKLWNVTPGVYIVGFIYTLILIGIGKIFERMFKIDYYKPSFLIGIIPVFFLYYEIVNHMKSPANFVIATSIAFTLSLFLFYILRGFLFNRIENVPIIFGHSLDAIASFIGIDFYGFGEEHILAEYLINLAGTAMILIPVKVSVITIVLHLIDRSYIRREISDLFYKMIKFVIFIIGFGPGFRNSFLITFV